MPAFKAAALAVRAMTACCVGLALSGCATPLADPAGSQASAGSAAAESRLLTQTHAATPSVSTPSPTPSLTPPPPTPSLSVPTPINLLLENGTLAYAVRRDGQSTVYLLPLGSPEALPLALGSDDRDPVFSPQGTTLAFASRRDGNSEIYLTDLLTGQSRRLTDTPEYDGRPAFSPDGQWIVYEHYAVSRMGICIVAASGGTPAWCDEGPYPSFSPSWSPQGRSIAFASRRELGTDLFLLDLDTLRARELTHTPDIDESDPVYSPDAQRLAFTAIENGYRWVFVQSLADLASPRQTAAQGSRPTWSPTGDRLASVFYPDALTSYLQVAPPSSILAPSILPLAGYLGGVSWTAATLPDPLPDWLQANASEPTPAARMAAATVHAGALGATLTPIEVQAPDARLSSTVVERFTLLRQAVQMSAGWDFLATLDSAVIGPGAPRPPQDELSWFRTGRTIAIARAAAAQGWLEVVPEPMGQYTYWHLFLRTRAQDGSMGEPLRDAPWDFDARASGLPTDYDRGGAYRTTLPPGYYIDFTLLAAEHGWLRVAADANWRSFYSGIRYWEFRAADGLDWAAAMLELFPLEDFLTPTPSITPTPRIYQYWFGPRPSDTRWPTPTY
jgi:TolB protein